jgi:hypothetical protein
MCGITWRVERVDVFEVEVNTGRSSTEGAAGYAAAAEHSYLSLSEC